MEAITQAEVRGAKVSGSAFVAVKRHDTLQTQQIAAAEEARLVCHMQHQDFMKDELRRESREGEPYRPFYKKDAGQILTCRKPNCREEMAV
ncbi:MAG TPA: hypothetical protein VFE01_08780, partial [Terracidiphilus sp.]|nr:hypothetical protein [Terracidiphilus sp.]